MSLKAMTITAEKEEWTTEQDNGQEKMKTATAAK